MEKNEVNGIQGEKPSLKNIFKNKDFLKLWIGQFVSNTGSQISFIIFPLFIYAYTGSLLWFGLIFFFDFIPILILSPFAGKFVDSHNRKYVMIIADLLNSIFVILIAIAITFDKIFPKNTILIVITILDVTEVAVSQFFLPARMASIPRLVKPEELGMTVSISQTTYRLITIIGPAIGVVIVTILGLYQYAFALDGLTFFFSALMVSLIRTDLNPLKSNSQDEEKPSLSLGVKSILKIKTIRYLVLTFSFVAFANIQFVTFMVAFEKGSLHMSDADYGITFSILGFSGVLMGIILAKYITRIHKPILFYTIGVLLVGINLLPVLIISQGWQMFIITFFDGALGVMATIPFSFVLLRDTTDSIRGQVQSALNMVTGLTTILGIAFGTVFAPILGVRDLFFLNAVIFVIIGLGGIFYLVIVNDLDSAIDQQLVITKFPVSTD